MITSGVVWMSSAVLAAVFVVSAAAKLHDPSSTDRALTKGGVPFASGLARVVPFVEVVTAALLVMRTTLGGLAALALLGLFTAFLASLLWRGVDVSCGCFGANESETVSHVDIVRNTLLAVLAVVAVTGGAAADVELEDVIAVTTAVAVGHLVITGLRTRRTLGQLFDNRLPGER
jgi:putative oxidoreductase